ncbi:MAG TPA: ATP-binding cassette domain-containing protein [Dehalococcoidia bacterium]|nr:ATP-binding cassette domain-containing protein [Dehalococcoidia bacterium]
MSQIVVENLYKSFRVPVRKGGLFGSVRSFMKREYREIQALRDISFELQEGELVGYIGPNGAGKSTTVKIMSGILVPDSGRCEILGRTPWNQRKEHVRNIGVVFGQRTQLWWDVAVIESFDLLRDIYRVPLNDYRKIKDELVDVLSLDSLLTMPVRQLSLGQRMRCELAASLLHQPPVLFLDEPTIGLDAVSKIAVRDFIRKINRDRNVTVILTTHDMDDIEALCSRVMVIGKGTILFDGSIARLRNTVTPERVVKIDFLEVPRKFEYPMVSLSFFDDSHAEYRFNPETITATDIIGAISQDNQIKDFVIENPPIEEIIARMYDGFAI